MITVVQNKTFKSVEIMMDAAGAALLIAKLSNLLNNEALGHLHIYATNDDSGVSTRSPYDHKDIFSELVLNILPADAWSDSEV